MSRRAVLTAFFILLAASLLKYVWLARYCHPMADDWSYAHQGITRDLLPWLQGEYLNWNGRYFSNVLVGKGPLVLGLDALWLYRSVPVMLVLLTAVAAFVLIRSFARELPPILVESGPSKLRNEFDPPQLSTTKHSY